MPRFYFHVRIPDWSAAGDARIVLLATGRVLFWEAVQESIECSLAKVGRKISL